MDANSVYIILSILGIGILVISMMSSMFGFDFFETDNPYLFKIFISAISGIGLGGLKWHLEGAIIMGLAFSALMGVIIYIVMMLKHEHGIDTDKTIGALGSVTISAEKNKIGKALLTVGGSLREVDIVCNKKVSNGDSVIVTSVSGDVFHVKLIDNA